MPAQAGISAAKHLLGFIDSEIPAPRSPPSRGQASQE